MLKRIIKALMLGVGILCILVFSINNLSVFKKIDSIKEPLNRALKEKKQKTTEIIYEENDLYQIIEKNLLEGNDSIKIPKNLIKKDQSFLFNIVEKTVLSNPEIMYYTGGIYTKGLLKFEYSKTKEEIKLHQDTIRKKRDEKIFSNIRPDMSDYEKVKTIHDYIINTTKYDKRYMNEDAVPAESHSVYGVLNEGVALCSGYAKTMKYLLNAVDIESMIVIGKTDYDNHAWNIVKIEGSYYHIDTTWDDPVTEDDSDVLNYHYFNLKDEDIEKTHSWNRSDYPKCNSNKYNYYYYNDFVVDNYYSFYNRIEKALWNKTKVVEIKILDFNEEIYNIPDTIDSIVKNKIQSIDIKEYRYSINNEQGIIRIELNYSK